MDSDKRDFLIHKVAQCLKEHGLGDIPVSMITENVGNMNVGQFEKTLTLKVDKTMVTDKKELVDRFEIDSKAFTSGY